MKKVCNTLSGTKFGFFFLLITSILMFIGAVVADFYELTFSKLNFMLFPQWFQEHSHLPYLYLWIFFLFAVLFFLAVNTSLCTIVYIKNIIKNTITFRKISIILFHFCFLSFLGGHLLYEFTENTETVVLEEGVIVTLPASKLNLAPLSILKSVEGLDVTAGPARTTAVIDVRNAQKESSVIKLRSMKPAFTFGHSFHIAMKDKGLSEKQTRIIVRKGYGIFLLGFGGLLVITAIILYIPYISRNS